MIARLKHAGGTGFACGVLMLLASTARAEESIQLIPGQFTLAGAAARQSLILESFSGPNAVGQITAGAAFTSSDPKIVKIEEGVAIPVANGKASLTAAAGDRTATAEVTEEATRQATRRDGRSPVGARGSERRRRHR